MWKPGLTDKNCWKWKGHQDYKNRSGQRRNLQPEGRETKTPRTGWGRCPTDGVNQQAPGPRRETKVSKNPNKFLASDSNDDFVPPGTKGCIRVTHQKSREVAAQKTKKKSEMDAKVSSEDSGLGAQSLPSISAGNLHSLSSDSILASVTSNQIPENAEIREYLPVMDTTDSGVYQSENGGQGNFPSQAPENSVNPKDSF